MVRLFYEMNLNKADFFVAQGRKIVVDDVVLQCCHIRGINVAEQNNIQDSSE